MEIKRSLGEFWKDSQIFCILCLFRGLPYPCKTKFYQVSHMLILIITKTLDKALEIPLAENKIEVK